MADFLVNAAEKILLSRPDGFTGSFTTISANAQGINYAAQGDGGNAIQIATGLWGGPSGRVIGFIIGGPLSEFIARVVGGTAAGEPEVLRSLPNKLQPEAKWNLIQLKIDNGILGNYRRHPSIGPGSDYSSFEIRTVDGENILYWCYAGRFYPVMLDLEKPNIAFICYYGNVRCLVEFKLNAYGDVEEWNPQDGGRFWWKKE